MSTLRYRMIIDWSDEDDCYLVHLPDFPEQTYRTHGDSYEEAAKNGEEVLHLLIEKDDLPIAEHKPTVATLFDPIRPKSWVQIC